MNKTMLLLLTAICVIVISYNPRPVFGTDPGSKDATCDISVTVDTIIEWDAVDLATFAIDLDALETHHIIAQGTTMEGTATLTLWTNCNVALSADNLTDPNMALLTHQRTNEGGEKDSLVTKYQISTDGDGDPTTGADATAVGNSHSDAWRTYDVFLKAPGNAPLVITHANTDGNVEVTLKVQATNDTGNVADSGLYTATQTITAAFAGDN